MQKAMASLLSRLRSEKLGKSKGSPTNNLFFEVTHRQIVTGFDIAAQKVPSPLLRVRCRARDGTEGWATVAHLEALVCRSCLVQRRCSLLAEKERSEENGEKERGTTVSSEPLVHRCLLLCLGCLSSTSEVLQDPKDEAKGEDKTSKEEDKEEEEDKEGLMVLREGDVVELLEEAPLKASSESSSLQGYVQTRLDGLYGWVACSNQILEAL